MLDALCDRVMKGPLFAAAMGAAFGVIGFLDFSTPLGVAVWLLYLLPIWLLSRVAPFDARLVAGGAAAATALIALTFLLAPADPDFWKAGLNRLIGVTLIWIVSLLLIRARRQQMALADSEQQFRVNFEMAAVGQAQLHVGTGCFIRVNDRFCDIAGYERSELLTMTPRDLTHPDDQIADEAGFLKIIRGDAEEYHHEKRYVRKDGDIRWVLVSVRLIRDADGQPGRAIAVVEDVTERKETETALMRLTIDLERRVSERTGALSDSQRKLRALTSELNLAEQRERRRLAGELHDYLAQLLVVAQMKLCQRPPKGDAIEEVTHVLDRALTYTRSLVAQLAPPVLQQFGLSAALSWLAEEMKRHEMIVTVHAPGERLPLSDDEAGLLFQSARELLMNVVKHAKIGRALVRLQRDEALLTVAVQDEGIGFDAGPALEKAVDKFGLFSIRERMYALGGSFTITSAPGQGTTATLTLTLGGEAAGTLSVTRDAMNKTGSSLKTESKSASRMTRNVSRSQIRVLLVDDHAMVREGLRTLLNGYPEIEVVGEAGDGEAAIDEARRLVPHVIVMDVNMPKMDGIEATRRIIRMLPDSAVIGLSVNASHHMQTAMRAAGGRTLLTKESAAELLYMTIKSVHLDPIGLLDGQEPLPFIE